MEKRRHVRVAYGVTVDVIWKDGAFAARVADISEGGVFIDTPQLLEVGAPCHLEIDLGFRCVTVAGEVMWHKRDFGGGSGGMGVHFIKISPASRAALAMFMQLQLSGMSSRPPRRRQSNKSTRSRE